MKKQKVKKELNKILKERKGITLIALVITIIVLLILAGVSIATLTGENGILNQAQKAKELHNEKSKEEEEELKNTTKVMDEILGVKAETVAESPGVYYGAKVNYMPDDKDIEWKIYYSDRNNIFLIASDYLPTNKITDEIKSKTGLEVDGNYKVFWGSTPAKQDYLIGKNGEDLKKSFKKDEMSSSDDREGTCKWTTLLNTENWTSFVDQNYADYSIGASTLEMFCDSWNSKGYKHLYYKFDGSVYTMGFDEEANGTGVGIPESEERSK